MNKIDLGQTITILANIGVIAGIVFLGMQIQEDRQQAIATNTLLGGAEITGWMDSVGSNADQAEILLRGERSFHELSELEQYRFDWLMRSLILKIGVARVARDSGLAALSEIEESRMLEGNLLRLLDKPGFREWWESTDRRGIPPANAQFVDRLADYGDR